ncbi:hypothetical protein [Clostridium sp.]|nr:hypothetical protein [Clostridium sp.]
MNLLNFAILLSLSIFILPALIGLVYISLSKNLPSDEKGEEFNISYEEF